eukprot:1816053-Pyramimonas_sp.AAC.1
MFIVVASFRFFFSRFVCRTGGAEVAPLGADGHGLNGEDATASDHPRRHQRGASVDDVQRVKGGAHVDDVLVRGVHPELWTTVKPQQPPGDSARVGARNRRALARALSRVYLHSNPGWAMVWTLRAIGWTLRQSCGPLVKFALSEPSLSLSLSLSHGGDQSGGSRRATSEGRRITRFGGARRTEGEREGHDEPLRRAFEEGNVADPGRVGPQEGLPAQRGGQPGEDLVKPPRVGLGEGVLHVLAQLRLQFVVIPGGARDANRVRGGRIFPQREPIA